MRFCVKCRWQQHLSRDRGSVLEKIQREFPKEFEGPIEKPQQTRGKQPQTAKTLKPPPRRRLGLRNPIAGVAAGSPEYAAARARRSRENQKARRIALQTGKTLMPDPASLNAVLQMLYPGSGRLPAEAQNVQNVADFLESRRPGSLTLGPASRYVSVYEVARELGIAEHRAVRWLQELGVRALDISGLQYIMLFDVEYACWKRTRPEGTDTSEAAFVRFLDSVGPRYSGLQRLAVTRRLKSAVATVAAAETSARRVAEPDSGVEQDVEMPDRDD